MGAQEDYAKEVVANASRVVAAAGLDRLPLVMALRQIAVAMERVGTARALKVVDAMSDPNVMWDDAVSDEVIRQILTTSDADVLAGNWPPLVASAASDD